MSTGSDLPIVLVPHPHVRVDRLILNGSPHIPISRVPVRTLWLLFVGGMPVEAIMKKLPQLTPAQVLDALSFAHDNPDLIEADVDRYLEGA